LLAADDGDDTACLLVMLVMVLVMVLMLDADDGADA
jgi:hypothetical protein